MIIFFLFCAFRSGIDKYYYKKANNRKADGSDVIFFFKPKNMLSLLRFCFNLYTRKLLLLILCFAPLITDVIFLNVYVNSYRASLTVAVILFLIAVILFINGIVFFIRFNSLFFVARYCFVSGEFSDYGRLFAFSFRCMEGKRHEVFFRKISFVPWFICCILLLPISFVRSYYNQTMAETASSLINLQYLQNE